MEISYKREPNKSHMILGDIAETNGYEEKMVAENDIPCLLKYAKAGSNGKCSYWYDISAKKSLKSFFAQEGINAKTVHECLKGISESVAMLNRFLLNPGNILLKPETIFLRNDGVCWRSYFAYVPGLGADFEKGVLSIAEYLISNVDHEDKDAVTTCYGLYETVSKGEFTIGELIDSINLPEEKSMFGLPDTHTGMDTEEDTDSGVNSINPFSRVVDEEDMFEDLPSNKKSSKKTDKKSEKPEKHHRFSLLKSPARSSKSKQTSTEERKPGLFESQFKRKKEELFPDAENLDDFIMDPVEPEPSVSFATTLMGGGEANFHRRLVYEGRGNHQDMEIEKTPFLIGSRQNGNDGVINEGVVSRSHARIIIKEDEYYLEDLESRNGTFLNGQILDFNKQARLTPGDRISFANIGFRFQ